MKRVLWSVLLAGCALILSVPTDVGAAPLSSERHRTDDVQRHWSDVKASLNQGAYRDALQSLEMILTVAPNDPWAQLYHALCDLRLKSTPAFTQLSPAQLASLKERLRLEEQAQRFTAIHQKALERQIRTEQAKWDEELKTLQQQAERDQKLKRRQVQAEAVRQARAERAKLRELAQAQALRQSAQPQAPPPAAAAPAPSTTTPEAASAPATPAMAIPPPGQPPTEGARAPSNETVTSFEKPIVTSSQERSIELPKVIVPTTPAGPAKEERPAPLVSRAPPPPGAVQINANQMSVSPDRNIAIADGDVEVMLKGAVMTCDHLTLFTDTKDVYAEGHVRLEEGHQVSRGEMAHYNVETKKGRFLQGNISSAPWYEHGRSVEHIAEGVYQVTPGYITSCELEPPHFKFYGRRAIIFADEKFARARNAALFVDQVPLLYLPWMSFSESQSPFFIVPGKRKPWGPFALMGYRYELPGPGHQRGTIKLDWRRYFLWGMGLDHKFESAQWGKALFKVYYNEEQTLRAQTSELHRGGSQKKRFRVLWRHQWQPMPDTSIITDIQKYGDVDFRKDLLFREEYAQDDAPSSFISMVKSTPSFTLTALMQKRVNPFQAITESLPQVTLDVREQRIGDTQAFSKTTFDFANFVTRKAHSSPGSHVIRVGWFQQLSYALSLFQPILVTPKAAVRQTFYTRDNQNRTMDRPNGNGDLISGQFSMGADASLKLFRIFPITTNVLGLNINLLRHIVTPTLSYSYVHPPTVPNGILSFPNADGTTNQLTFGLENKLQTKRAVSKEKGAKLQSVDIARLVLSAPYTFRGNGNKQGGRINDWPFRLELYPWPWMRLESDWSVPSHVVKGTQDERIKTWNLDLVMVGGKGQSLAQQAPAVQETPLKASVVGPKGGIALLIPEGQWYFGLGRRYSQNDKTEDVLELDWRLSKKWEIGTFHRFTEKEVAGSAKRFNNLREYQYTLRRDLHDWLAELVYRVDREFGEEVWFTMTLKAYPNMPIAFSDSYHQPKFGSQSSPFSPLHGQTPQ